MTKDERNTVNKDELRLVILTVALWVHPDADVQEVVSEMEYSFTHEDIVDSEITDINTEV